MDNHVKELLSKELRKYVAKVLLENNTHGTDAITKEIKIKHHTDVMIDKIVHLRSSL